MSASVAATVLTTHSLIHPHTTHPRQHPKTTAKQVAAHCGWPPEDGLTKLPGFSGPWQRALCRGRVLKPDDTLQQAGLVEGATVTVVRVELVAEGWKVRGAHGLCVSGHGNCQRIHSPRPALTQHMLWCAVLRCYPCPAAAAAGVVLPHPNTIKQVQDEYGLSSDDSDDE